MYNDDTVEDALKNRLYYYSCQPCATTRDDLINKTITIEIPGTRFIDIFQLRCYYYYY